MKFFEFGKEHKKLMVMLHGGGVSYLGAVPVAEYVSKKFHVVLAGGQPERFLKEIMKAHSHSLEKTDKAAGK